MRKTYPMTSGISAGCVSGEKCFLDQGSCTKLVGRRVVVGTAKNAQIWASDDGGDTWTLKKDISNDPLGANQINIFSLTFDSHHNKLVAGSGKTNAQIWVSADEGDTWTLKKDLSKESPAQSTIRALTFDSHNKVLVAGTYYPMIKGNPANERYGQIWTSADGGNTWALKKDFSTEPTPQRIQSLCFDSHHNRILVGTHPNAQIWTYNYEGDIWEFKTDLSTKSPSQRFLSTLTFNPQNNMLLAGTGDTNAQIWASTDGGDTWTLKADLSSKPPATADRVYGIAIDSNNNKLVAVTGSDDNAQIWTSDYSGDTWELKADLSDEMPAQRGVLTVTFDFQNNMLFAGTGDTNAQIWVSADGGNMWTLKADLSTKVPPQTSIFSLITLNLGGMPTCTHSDCGR